MGRIPKKVPRFRSEQEEAEFWDTHSIVDYLDEMEPVEVEVKKPLGHVLSVRVDSQDFHGLAEMARAEGVGVTTMARMLLKATLKRRKQDPAPRTPLKRSKPLSTS